MRWKTTTWKIAALSTVLGGMMLFGAGGMAQAADRDDHCRGRTRQQERQLDHDTRHHGFYSRQAQRDRHRLHELREHCGYQGRHWDRDRGRDRDRDDR